MLTHAQAQERMRCFAQACEREAEERSRQLKLYLSDEREKSHETARIVVEPESSDIEGLGWTFSVRAPSEKDAGYAGGCWFVRASDGAIFSLSSSRRLWDQARALPPGGGWRDDSQTTNATGWDSSGVVAGYPAGTTAGEHVGDDLVLCWWISTPGPEATEEDGRGLPNGAVRELLILQNGLWAVYVDDGGARSQVMQVMRSIFKRSLQEVSSIVVPGVIHTGTRGEVELLAKALTGAGATARLERV